MSLRERIVVVRCSAAFDGGSETERVGFLADAIEGGDNERLIEHQPRITVATVVLEKEPAVIVGEWSTGELLKVSKRLESWGRGCVDELQGRGKGRISGLLAGHVGVAWRWDQLDVGGYLVACLPRTLAISKSMKSAWWKIQDSMVRSTLSPSCEWVAMMCMTWGGRPCL